MRKILGKIKRKLSGQQPPLTKEQKTRKSIEAYLAGGRVPWSEGYHEYKWDCISKIILEQALENVFKKGQPLPDGFGMGLDERIVEYPWILSHIPANKLKLLDAGSTFNFLPLVEHPKVADKNLTIATFYPESNNYCSKRISYMFCDLRELPFRDAYFDMVVSQSTIEHIGMDNSIYGYQEGKTNAAKVFDYLSAVQEYVRVLKAGGDLLLTFPFGTYENHGFFQQFDNEMLTKLLSALTPFGTSDLTFFTYKKTGWEKSSQRECETSSSYNPHTGKGKSDDNAAHCRAICCIHFAKSVSK